MNARGRSGKLAEPPVSTIDRFVTPLGIGRRRSVELPTYTGNAVVLNTVRNENDECICATPGNRAR